MPSYWICGLSRSRLIEKMVHWLASRFLIAYLYIKSRNVRFTPKIFISSKCCYWFFWIMLCKLTKNNSETEKSRFFQVKGNHYLNAFSISSTNRYLTSLFIILSKAVLIISGVASIVSISQVIWCSPQKSNISWVSFVPPIKLPQMVSRLKIMSNEWISNGFGDMPILHGTFHSIRKI